MSRVFLGNTMPKGLSEQKPFTEVRNQPSQTFQLWFTLFS